MDAFGFPVAALTAVLLLLLLSLVALGVRRYQLRRTLGTFDASLCHAPGKWELGIGRYADKHLEWMRLLSLSPRPRRRYLRSSLELKGWRQPTEQESTKVQPGTVVAMLSYEGQDLQLALSFEVYAGLSAWLEAGPVIGIGTWR
ncbi:DUF2550 domain-containing protein [Arthrobacter sp. I2-34]|uniref:DUF2550 domain-containing protein n=1 Tax=Arthrobacter hankyongi TaxID=2904801 RepID=A0ABS9LBE8_9MICC|nr:DUF2550 domain-containing protein [Arthrobacter hankyongi]MCG2624001.1 DUF2550 domain-containing protein [Arthrobacter hankyongi]